MAAPIKIALVLANTKTGRKVVIGLLILIVLIVGFVTTPLFAVPLAIAGQSIKVEDSPAQPAAAPVTGDWTYPLAGSYFKGRGFGYNPVAGCGFCSTNHLGYDMSQGCGSTIYAAGAGSVITAGAFHGWGNTVRIDHSGVVTLYGHMQWGSLRVSVGDTVAAGTPIGSEGDTGRSFGCHLHYEVQQGGIPIDPQPFMAARGLPLT